MKLLLTEEVSAPFVLDSMINRQPAKVGSAILKSFMVADGMGRPFRIQRFIQRPRVRRCTYAVADVYYYV
ncbi:hypothetical protein R1flu_011642 [Riccia fluitans]|uniref:Uncharacterized protein n=1 Tax=Riccia fluitans TaxID=41844 RepID=A0ABD1Z8C1_9MARC